MVHNQATVSHRSNPEAGISDTRGFNREYGPRSEYSFIESDLRLFTLFDIVRYIKTSADDMLTCK